MPTKAEKETEIAGRVLERLKTHNSKMRKLTLYKRVDKRTLDEIDKIASSIASGMFDDVPNHALFRACDIELNLSEKGIGRVSFWNYVNCKVEQYRSTKP